MLTDLKSSFFVRFDSNFVARLLLYFPLHLKHITTVPCDIHKFTEFDIFNTIALVYFLMFTKS